MGAAQHGDLRITRVAQPDAQTPLNLARVKHPLPLPNEQDLLRLRNMLLGLAALIGLLLAASCGWQVYADRQRTLEAEGERLQSLSLALSGNSEVLFRGAAGLLRRIQRDIGRQGGLARFDERALHELLQGQLALLQEQANGPALHSMWVADAQGKMLGSSETYPGASIQVADREYFQHHRDTASSAVWLSPLLQSRISGQWVNLLTLRLNDPQGAFAGVLGISIRADYFERFYRALNLGKENTIALVREDGKLLYRHPFDARYTNIDLAQEPDFRRVRESGNGTFTSLSPFDGKLRIIGYTRGGEFPFFAVVSAHESSVLSQWRENSLIYALLGLLAYLAVLAFCYFGLRQLRHLLAVSHVSLHDPLTALPNRRYFDQLVEAEWRRAARSQQPFAFLFVDIDHFKAFNDRYGHDRGDQCLRQVASALSAGLKRAGDMVVRYGGEEFVCILPDTDLAGARQVGASLVASIAALALPNEGAGPAGIVTISAGVAAATPQRGESALDLLQRADEALYSAKNAGRNRVAEAAPAAH